MPCSHPHGARPVLVGCVGVAVDQSLLSGVAADRLLLQPVEPFLLGADPEVSLPVFVEMPGRDRNNPVGAVEVKSSLKARTNVHHQGLVSGGAHRHFLGRAGRNHVAYVVRGDSYPFTVDSFKPECSTLIERYAPEGSFCYLLRQSEVNKVAMGEATDLFMIVDPESG